MPHIPESMTDDFADLAARLPHALGADRHRLRQRLRGLQRARRQQQACDRQYERLVRDIERSCALREQRATGVPRVTFDPALPITEKLGEIRAALQTHPVVIVCGETGSGKSTQLPKLCLELGRGIDGRIGHTQPRRIAARAIAARLAEELGSPLGRDVGFKIRFTDTTQPATYIKLMTDGILLAETQHDRFLEQYDTLIVDEAHERSLNIDFLVGYLKRLLTKRRDLKLIITSATIDANRFAAHFAAAPDGPPAPVINVSGRTYPIEVRYHPLVPPEDGADEPDLLQAIGDAAAELVITGPGDILVFLPTEREILEAAKVLRGRHLADAGLRAEILPLYARLSVQEQNKIFQPHSQRRIVLATNVAESSLTVPGIRFVIDTGTARISRYSPRRKVQRLPIEPISQASADQRAGRCGRVGPGICVRLYSEAEHLVRERFTTPEIRRASLAAVILQAEALQLGVLEEFPFLDPPKGDAIRDGYQTLYELGALDDEGGLTEIGQRLARLPVDPRIGRMILAADQERCLQEVLIIAAALEVQDPRDRPADKQPAADACHSQFQDESSDFLSYLKLWDFYHALREKLSKNQLQKACRQNFLSPTRMREWLDIHRQLCQLAEEAGLRHKPRRNDYGAIHRALLRGLLSNVARRSETYEYTGAGGNKFHLWPGSGVFAQKPAWIMAAELVETTRNYARTVARIEPRWIEDVAGHLLERSYSDAHWSRRAASAMAYERAELAGLAVVHRRRVRYSQIAPLVSRELFLRHGLVEGQFNTGAAFLSHNQKLLKEIESLAAKTRRTDLFVSAQTRFDFYDARVPAHVCDGNSFERWRGKAERKAPRLLFMTRAELVPEETATAESQEKYPEGVQVGERELPLHYHFAPGTDDDGITVVVPQSAVEQLSPGRLGWLVPGMLEEKVVALIRTLPKASRRLLVPAPDTARRAVAELQFGEGSFADAVAQALTRVSGEPIAAHEFQWDRLPPHLQMNVHIVDDRGQVIVSGRDLEQLRRELHSRTAAAFAASDQRQWQRDDLVAWDFGDLPAEVRWERSGLVVTGYPTLVDQGASVSLRLAPSAVQAAAQTRRGIRRLCCLAERDELRAQVAWLPNLDKLELLAAPLCSARSLEQQLSELLADRAFLDTDELPRTADAFRRFLDRGREQIGLAVQDVTRLVLPLLEAQQAARLAVERLPAGRWPEVTQDLRGQLANLTPSGFLSRTPWQWLQHFPRYFHAIELRVDKLLHGAQLRNQQHTAQVANYWRAYLQRAEEEQAQGICDPELEQFRWMLEELRVSLFAQELGTSLPISTKRLQQQWAKVG
jgi:ATP-dependent helicase HrpA